MIKVAPKKQDFRATILEKLEVNDVFDKFVLVIANFNNRIPRKALSQIIIVLNHHPKFINTSRFQVRKQLIRRRPWFSYDLSCLNCLN